MSYHTETLSQLMIDLTALKDNWRMLDQRTNSQCGAVVKADAYGLGARHVGPALYQAGCRHFFVITFDEAVALRDALPQHDAAITILDKPWGAPAKEYAALRVVPVLSTKEDIDYWRAHQGGACTVQLDTGMTRLGINAQSAGDLSDLDIYYVMSHLACADEKNHPLNLQQLENFRAQIQALDVNLRYGYSFANSAGIFLGPDYHFDLVRPGAGLYGINPLAGRDNPSRPVAYLKVRVLQVRDTAPGASVGYGATYKSEKPQTLACVGLGYADGYFRALSNGRGHVIVQGTACPVVGRVSMCHIIVDVSAVPRPVRPGDWAEILGETQTVDMLATAAGTIGYEVLTALGPHFEKTYE